MKKPSSDIDLVTRQLLQQATVRLPSEDFASRLMDRLAREEGVERGAPVAALLAERRPWEVYIIAGIGLIAFAGYIFQLLWGAAPGTEGTPLVMQTQLTQLLVDYSRSIRSFLQEHYLIPIVLNTTCVLILLDQILRRRMLPRSPS